MSDLNPKPPVLGNPFAAPHASTAPQAPAGPHAGTPTPPGARPPVNRTKQYILERIGKQREQIDESLRLKQEAEERLKKAQQESAEYQGQVRALEKQVETLRGELSSTSKDRERLQGVQNLLTMAQKEKEMLEAEVVELRTAMDEIHRALG